MNKLFAALLFFCVVGASVLWWLMKTLPDSETTQPQVNNEEVLKEQDQKTEKPVEDKEESVKYLLRIDSAPSSAKVEIDGVYQGTTPVDVELANSRSNAKIILDGYEVYTREVPSIADADVEELIWKVTLKEKASSEGLKPSDLYRGAVAGFFIQLKALKASDTNDAQLIDILSGFREQLSTSNLKLCMANLGSKGKWYRVLVGPYKSSSSASSALKMWKNKIPSGFDGFVTGRQNCL